MRIIFCVAASLAVSGCATSYQPKSFTGGYSDLQLNADTFKISVEGNGYTSKDRASNLAMLRAADLTIEHGGSRFVVVEGGTESNYAGSTSGTAQVIGRTAFFTPGAPIFKPSSDLVIRIVRPPDPAFAGALDASLIATQLRPILVPQ